MTTGEKTGIGIAITIFAGIGVYILGVYQGWWKNIFAKPEPAPAEKSEYEKCLEVNKAKQDGDACTSCVPANSSESVFNGEIKDGECKVKEAPAPPITVKRYMVGNQNGALVYMRQGNVFISPRQAVKIPYGTEVKIISFSLNKQYVNTDRGWLTVADVTEKLI